LVRTWRKTKDFTRKGLSGFGGMITKGDALSSVGVGKLGPPKNGGVSVIGEVIIVWERDFPIVEKRKSTRKQRDA